MKAVLKLPLPSSPLFCFHLVAVAIDRLDLRELVLVEDVAGLDVVLVLHVAAIDQFQARGMQGHLAPHQAAVQLFQRDVEAGEIVQHAVFLATFQITANQSATHQDGDRYEKWIVQHQPSCSRVLMNNSTTEGHICQLNIYQ
jgi:hypothetical protein